MKAKLSLSIFLRKLIFILYFFILNCVYMHVCVWKKKLDQINPTLSVGLRIFWLDLLQRANTNFKRGVLNMTLNCIQQWGSSSGAQGDVESPFHCHYSQVYSDLLESHLWVK